MFKSILTTLLVSGALGMKYGEPAGYKQVYTTVTNEAPQYAASTSCTKDNGVVHTAQPEYTPPSYTASAVYGGGSAPVVHEVIVGGDAGLVYTPEFIYAAVGDIVEFHFQKQNHSVTQSTFAKPCVKKLDGIDSGLTPNPNNTIVPHPIFKYTVDTTEATWWYCKQRTGTHCGKGMTFAINPTKEKTFEQFKSMAIAQNGTVATSTAGAAPTYAPPAGASTTVTLVAGPGETSTETYSAPSSVATWVDGSGQGAGGACQCQCFCGVAAYPSGYGVNGYGGMPGALPAPWVTTTTALAAPAVSAPGGYYKR